MEEELTTLMHMEFCLDEKERIELAVYGVFNAVFYHQTLSFSEALKKYGITEQIFWENPPFDHMLEFPNKTLEELRKTWPDFEVERYEKYKACKSKEEVYYLIASYEREDQRERKRLFGT
jgi:hypothetical protein